jgi:Zn-dependent protease with chaperone function
MAAILKTMFSDLRAKGALFCLVVVSAASLVAAGSPRVDAPELPQATLSLNLNSPGQMDIDLYVFPPPPSGAAPFQEALKASRGCGEVQASSPDMGPDGLYLEAQCVGVTFRQGLIARGDLDFSPLLRELRTRGIKTLTINLYSHLGGVPFASEGPAEYEANLSQRSVRRFDIPTDAPSPPIIHIQVGYSRRTMARMFIPLLALLLLPIALTLYMRRAVLSKSQGIRSGAWFGYWRFLQWTTLALLIFWVPAVGVVKFDPFLTFILSSHTGGATLITVCLVAFYFLPPIPINILCRVLSYRVFVEVQGAHWTRKEILQQAFWSHMAGFVPFGLGVAGILLIGDSSAVWGPMALLAAIIVMAFSTRRLRKAMNLEVQALTTGELRDRAFALAEKAKVKLQQVYVMPTRKARMANAFARTGSSILLTDYLLERLSKREVDGVIAHELAHLKNKHPGLLILAICVVMGGSVYAAGGFDTLIHWLPEGSLLPLGFLLGLVLYYLIARYF